MRTIRVHVDMPLVAGARVDLSDAAAEHVLRVLRLRIGDALTLFNGDGHDYAGVIESTDRRRASVRIDSRATVAAESPLALTLAQALARGDKMDWIVQKATELGVHRIVPLDSERSEVRLDEARAQAPGPLARRSQRRLRTMRTRGPVAHRDAPSAGGMVRRAGFGGHPVAGAAARSWLTRV